MPVYNPQRPVKPEENHHRALGTNLIGTLAMQNGQAAGAWAPGGQMNPLFNLGQALTWSVNQGNQPLLWVFESTHLGYEVKFGFDMFVPNLAVGALGAPVKIGHLALAQNATISGEIRQNGAAWSIDNNSGAWGSMANLDGKSTMMATVAQLITQCDPGGIVVTAHRAYSRKGWKRVVQQCFR